MFQAYLKELLSTNPFVTSIDYSQRSLQAIDS
jgi:hypothetical protein